MTDQLSSLIQAHHAFYEVLPYYIVVDAADGLSMQRIHAGFDVDIYGESLNNEMVIPGPDPDYADGFAELKTIAEDLSHHATDFCTLEAIDFPSTVFFDMRRRGRAEGLIRIRISHYRGVREPAGMPEQLALEQLESELKNRGIARR